MYVCVCFLVMCHKIAWPTLCIALKNVALNCLLWANVTISCLMSSLLVLNFSSLSGLFCLLVEIWDKGAKARSFGVCIVLYSVLQKSDAKIQITITTAYVVRIKYPLGGFIMAALCNGGPLYFCPVVSFFFLLAIFFFFSSPNLSGRRLDVCHISTHGVALVRI